MLGKSLTKLCLFFLAVFILNACSNVEKVQHIEVFALEVLEQSDDGLFEKNGYKKVNAITTTEESGNHIETDLKNIEDFYDIEGNYIRTEISHSIFKKSSVTQAEESNERKEEVNEPSTILIPDENIDHFELDEMTKEEEKKVKEHVLSFMEML